jgi:hypothetical protein
VILESGRWRNLRRRFLYQLERDSDRTVATVHRFHDAEALRAAGYEYVAFIAYQTNPDGSPFDEIPRAGC